ncbi:MAG: hypothetical protein LBE50_01475, partial [Gallionellaceae bacterium]|nr:hypothetical protein [Gallionellaceae bacterium]
MNAATWSEPNKLPAGILTLAVHALLFALLYFGISWRNDPPQGMTVDIWSDLPATQAPATTKPATPPPQPAPPPKPAPEPPKPAPSVKADINLGEKKPPKPAEPAPKAEAPPSAAQVAQQQALQAQAAATGKIVDDYTGRIRAKIRGYVFVPDNVADDAQVQFDVT